VVGSEPDSGQPINAQGQSGNALDSNRDSVSMSKKAGVTVSFNFFNAGAQKEELISQPETDTDQKRFAQKPSRGM
jgi:hypothetical protein